MRNLFENGESGERFVEVWALLNGDYPDEKALDEAQKLLDGVKEKDAEWHYVQAAVDFYKRFYYDCRKRLKKAIRLDPENGKYRAALAELEETVKSAKEAGKPLPEGKWDGCAEGCCEACCESLC